MRHNLLGKQVILDIGANARDAGDTPIDKSSLCFLPARAAAIECSLRKPPDMAEIERLFPNQIAMDLLCSLKTRKKKSKG